jgi:hypothetical protein
VSHWTLDRASGLSMTGNRYFVNGCSDEEFSGQLQNPPAPSVGISTQSNSMFAECVGMIDPDGLLLLMNLFR